MTKLYDAGNYILIHADNQDPPEHRHRAAHIIVSLGGTVKVFTGGKMLTCQGVRIPSGLSHRVDTCGHPALVFLFDSTTGIAARIREPAVLSEEDCRAVSALYRVFEQDPTAASCRAFERQLLTRLGLDAPACNVTDPRILAAMETVRQRLPEPITCREIADSVFLSQSRFSHLFRQQTGMTFAAYLICQRLLYCYTRILAGASITEAALEAGFSSSSHFAETNRRVFGISAGAVTKNMRFIKIQ